MPSPVARQLRQQTADTHERVEARLDLLDPDLSVARLRFVLARFAGFWVGIEPQVEGWATRHPDAAAALRWPRRRRTAILRADLLRLGETNRSIDALPQALCPFGYAGLTDAQVLGWLYVAEGSTLGGAVIDRTARSRADSPLTTVRTFHPYVEGPGPMWRDYLEHLHGWVGTDAARLDAVTEAGQHAFAALDRWLEPVSAQRVVA